MPSLTETTFTSPVPEAQRWLRGVQFPQDRPLLNVSQAAPTAPPPPQMRAAMAAALEDAATHRYSPDLGIPALRAALARSWSGIYGGDVAPEQTAITAGCNQAFAATIAAICARGDEVILPTPWYFNHRMWLDMAGMQTVPLDTGATLLPDPEHAAALITPRTRAIVLVSPNNPGGIEYPAELVARFYDLADAHGLKLIIDETYRDFLSRPGAPHDLLTRPGWDKTLIQLYSFSKAYRLTGHRVGALIGAEALMPEVEKFIDTVTICPSGLGQRAALWGLENLAQWVASEAAEIAQRRAAIASRFPQLAAKGWQLRGLGAYFAYVAHPFEMTSDALARHMVTEASILALPGTMFVPAGDPSGARHLRLAYANIDAGQIGTLFDRLAGLNLPLAAPGGAA